MSQRLADASAQNVRLNNAKNIYRVGIRDGQPREAMAKYTGQRYTQHSTGVKDGQAGFIEFFEDFIARNPERDIQIVRGFEDGRYVFLHAYQSLNDGATQWVTMDLFDTDAANDLLTINGNQGDDAIKAEDGVESRIAIVLNGNAGDDYL